jgi:hypothetical protein
MEERGMGQKYREAESDGLGMDQNLGGKVLGKVPFREVGSLVFRAQAQCLECWEQEGDIRRQEIESASPAA